MLLTFRYQNIEHGKFTLEAYELTSEECRRTFLREFFRSRLFDARKLFVLHSDTTRLDYDCKFKLKLEESRSGDENNEKLCVDGKSSFRAHTWSGNVFGDIFQRCQKFCRICFRQTETQTCRRRQSLRLLTCEWARASEIGRITFRSTNSMVFTSSEWE